MKPTRTLSLAKETLTELTPHELGAVAGGQRTYDCPSHHCYSQGLRCFLSERNACLSEDDLC